MLVWIAFIALILVFLALDLGVFHKDEHVIKTKEAAIWTAIWVTVALAFSGVIYWLFDSNLIANPTGLTPSMAVIKYITGY
ncbi:MAG: tellurite resistance protein TerC, partial [Patiriisocius sp.]